MRAGEVPQEKRFHREMMVALNKLVGSSATPEPPKVTVNVEPPVVNVNAPNTYDQVVARTSSADNTAVNFYRPRAGKQFVVTTILLTADSNVQTSAVINVYEGSSLTSTVVDKSILFIDLRKNEFRDLIGLNLLITGGKFLNLKATDSDVSATIMGYYVPVVSVQ